MKKIFLLTIFVTFIFSAATCSAKDVWVERNSSGVEIYVMDDTIKGNNSQDYFSVSTKKVRNGNLEQVVVWKFSKVQNGMWRYETSTMGGTHTTVVSVRNKVFEFCMNQLGWSYRVDGMYYE